MQYDTRLTISEAGSRKACLWPRRVLYWSELITRLSTPARGVESLSVYLTYKKAQQAELKDVGGFVGGTFKGDRRKAAYVEQRQIITLDFDSLPALHTQPFLRILDGLGCAYAVYSTRKHRPDAPRMRVLLPLLRPVTADEYEPAARKLAELIGIGWCDPTTFEAARLMYWPSVCADAEYVYSYGDKPFADPGGLLGLYGPNDAWRDSALWPQVPGVVEKEARTAKQQEDPTAKRGIVGAFCRAYDVPRAMEELIPGVYEPCAEAGRYSYTGGSTTGGAVVYGDGRWLYSHHATDPAGGELVNAFDLVRLHLFGALDDTALSGTPGHRLPSFRAMAARAESLDEVRLNVLHERASAGTDFALTTPEPTLESDEWMLQLTDGPNGQGLAKTYENAMLILQNDRALTGHIRLDLFRSRIRTAGGLPWDAREEPRNWADTDYDFLGAYFERRYRLSLPDGRVRAVVGMQGKNNPYHEVRAYLDGLPAWDGTPRLDRLLTTYMGVEDTPYARAVTRKSFAACVARVYVPGIKFDTVLTLVGPQGLGKSTLLRTLAGSERFTDSLQSFDGRESYEILQGMWLVEIGELNALGKSSMAVCKQFLSKQDDTYRAAYARVAETVPRQCVFFGTTNKGDFLHDPTGERRWWPVDTRGDRAEKDVFADLPGERDQIWAEAVFRYRMGEPLYLDKAMEAQARHVQGEHKERDDWAGLVEDYVARALPEDWSEMDLASRRMWLGGMLPAKGAGAVPRSSVCSLEVWCECLGMDKARIDQRTSRRINDIIEGIPGWKKQERSYFKLYGRQRGYCFKP